MTMERRKFKREGEEKRRDQLIGAALELVAAEGLQGATVRAIAAHAGVTQGLIRHYFASKEDLIRAAYFAHMDRMSTDSRMASEHADGGPEARLAAFAAAALRPPVADPKAFGLWASFVRIVREDPEMKQVHRDTYLQFRDALQSLIAALPGTRTTAEARSLAIACNGVIDGLWLEASIYAEGFEEDEPARIGLHAISKILGADILSHMPPPPAALSE